MNNAEKFKQIFGLRATELWSMPEGDFLVWLNRDVEATQTDHIAESGKMAEQTAEIAQNVQNDDLISRQAAIELATKYCPDDDGAVQCDGDIRGLLDELENLPPTQPDVPDINVGDMISRQAAIEAVKKHYRAHDNDLLELITFDIERLPSAQPEQKWIPVSERLPELDEDGYSQKVLACFGNYSGCDILEYRAAEGIGKWYIGDMDDSPEDIGVMVLVWMPLPEPYKGERYG